MGPKSDLVPLEYWPTCFHQFCRICNHRRFNFCRCHYLLLFNIRHSQICLHHNPPLQSNHNQILHYFIYLLFLISAACRPGLQVYVFV